MQKTDEDNNLSKIITDYVFRRYISSFQLGPIFGRGEVANVQVIFFKIEPFKQSVGHAINNRTIISVVKEVDDRFL